MRSGFLTSDIDTSLSLHPLKSLSAPPVISGSVTDYSRWQGVTWSSNSMSSLLGTLS
jgi:hypothetical protein